MSPSDGQEPPARSYAVNAVGYIRASQTMPTSATSRPAFAGTSTWRVYVPSSVQPKPDDGPTMTSATVWSSAGTHTGRRPEMVPAGPEPAVNPAWMVEYSGRLESLALA